MIAPISDILAIMEKYIPIERIPPFEKEQMGGSMPQRKLLMEMDTVQEKSARECFNKYYIRYCEYDMDGIILRHEAIESGLVIHRAHLQEFVDCLQEPGRFEEATSLFDAYFPKLLVGQAPLKTEHDKISAKEKRLLISQAYLPHLVIPTNSCESFSIKQDKNVNLYPRTDVVNKIFNLIENVIDKGDAFLRNCEDKKKKDKEKKEEDLNGGTYQTLTRISILNLGDELSGMYKKARKLSPRLPHRPVFIDAGGGQGRIAIALAAYLGWFTISLEIFPTKVYVASFYGEELFRCNFGHRLQTTFFQGDATVPRNWDGVNIFMVWDAAFNRENFEGIIENIARSKDNNPFVLVTSKRNLTLKRETEAYGRTRKEFVEELFQVVSTVEVRASMKGSNESDILVIWLLTKKLDTPIKMLQCCNGPSIVEDAKKQLGIVDVDACQVWAHGQKIGVSDKDRVPIVCNKTRVQNVIAIWTEMLHRMGGKGARQKNAVDRFGFPHVVPQKKKRTGIKMVVRKNSNGKRKITKKQVNCAKIFEMNRLSVERKKQVKQSVVSD